MTAAVSNAVARGTPTVVVDTGAAVSGERLAAISAHQCPEAPQSRLASLQIARVFALHDLMAVLDGLLDAWTAEVGGFN